MFKDCISLKEIKIKNNSEDINKNNLYIEKRHVIENHNFNKINEY